MSFNESLFLNLKKLWYKKKGVLKLFSRFSDQFITQIDRKLLEGNSINYFNPYLETNDLVELVSLNSMLRNVMKDKMWVFLFFALIHYGIVTAGFGAQYFAKEEY